MRISSRCLASPIMMFGTSPAMISQWCYNGNAAEYLDPKNSVSISQKVELFHGVAKGINYLHTFDLTKIQPDVGDPDKEWDSYGIKLVHGDLKPLNVLVDNGVAKLCDFGLLRLVHESAPTGMTTTSSHSGTTRYLSYELVSDQDDMKPTTASDIYALACIGVQFIYSRPPHANIADTGPNPSYKIMKAIEMAEPPTHRPANCAGAVSDIWNLFEKCWSIDPVERPDAGKVCEYLEGDRQQLVAGLESHLHCSSLWTN